MQRAIAAWWGMLLFGLAFNAAADPVVTNGDSWHTWQVDDSAAGSGMCCFTWAHGDVSRSGCDLDGRNLSFSDHGDCAAAPGRLQIYARMKDGKLIAIHALSSNCPVSTESKLVDLGVVSAAENLDWFRGVIENRQLDIDTREHALMALVMTESNIVFEYLDQLLGSR